MINLIRSESFYFADCLILNSGQVLSYSISGRKLAKIEAMSFDDLLLTDIYTIFSLEKDGSIYSAGEASAHGSCGFFYKMTDDKLDWALMSLEYGPFVKIELENHHVVNFISSSGAKWVVPNNDILCLSIMG